MAARSFLTTIAPAIPRIVSNLEPICQPPWTPDRVAACAALSQEKTAKAAAERAGSFVGTVLQPLVTSLGSALVPGSGLVSSVVTKLASQPTISTGGRPMAFSDGDSGFFGSFPDFGQAVSGVLQGGLGQQLLGIGTQALSGFVQQQFQPQVFQTSMAAVPAIATGARAMAVVGRRFFDKFPNLATGIQALRNQGKNVTRSNLWSLMKRFGPDFLVTGGILTAAAVSELAMAGPGRRRMNPGNVKALRRAHRRMKSFHNVCMTNDRLLGGRRRSTKSRGFAPGTSVVSVK